MPDSFAGSDLIDIAIGIERNGIAFYDIMAVSTENENTFASGDRMCVTRNSMAIETNRMNQVERSLSNLSNDSFSDRRVIPGPNKATHAISTTIPNPFSTLPIGVR